VLHNARITLKNRAMFTTSGRIVQILQDSRWLESAGLSGERLLMTRIDGYREKAKKQEREREGETGRLTAVFRGSR